MQGQAFHEKFRHGTFLFILQYGLAIALSVTVTAALCILCLPAWLVTEAVFYLYLRRRRNQLLEVDYACRTPHQECIRHLHCFQTSIIKLQKVFPGLAQRVVSDWFLGEALTEISRADALQWMSQSFLFRDYDELSADDKIMVEGITDELECALKHKAVLGSSFEFKNGERSKVMLQPGFNVCGPYESTHYPFCVYLGLHFFKRFVGLLFRRLGFQRLVQGERGRGFAYWYKRGDASKQPIVLLHGIGTGPSSYAVLLKALCLAHPNAPIIALEIPHIAMELPHTQDWADHFSEEAFCENIELILSAHRFTAKGKPKPVLIAHSFGCFIARWMLDSRKRTVVVGGAVFLDPLNFLLPYPDISMRLASEPKNFYEFLVRRLIMRESCVAYVLNRKGIWPRCCIWQEDFEHLPNNFKIEVALSKRDLFFDTRVVAAYLDHCMGEALNHHTFECTHGGILFRPDILEHVVHMVTRVEE